LQLMCRACYPEPYWAAHNKPYPHGQENKADSVVSLTRRNPGPKGDEKCDDAPSLLRHLTNDAHLLPTPGTPDPPSLACAGPI
jgi:hypothetical protein